MAEASGSRALRSAIPCLRNVLISISRAETSAISRGFNTAAVKRHSDKRDDIETQGTQSPASTRLEFLDAFSVTTISDNGRELLSRSVKQQIIDALHLGHVNMAVNLLNVLGSCKNSLTIDELMSFLEYCSNTPDPKFALELWRFMKEENIFIDQNGYNHIICALSKGGYLDEALNLLKALGENTQTTTTLPMYNTFLSGCFQYQSQFHALKCLELMERQNIGKSEITYTELMKLAVPGNNIAAVYQVWKEYSNFYSPSIVSLRKLVQSLCRIHALQEANDALQKMIVFVSDRKHKLYYVQKGACSSRKMSIPIPVQNDEMNSKKSIMKVISKPPTVSEREAVDGDKIYITSHHRNILPEGLGFMDYMRSSVKNPCYPGLRILRDAFNDVIHLAALMEDYKMVEQLFLQMIKLGLKPIVQTYNSLLRGAINEKGFIAGMKVIREVVDNCERITKFIYGHGILRSLFLRHSKGKEISRPGATRFATHFLSLRSLLDARVPLGFTFISEEWVEAMEMEKIEPNNYTLALLVVWYSRIKNIDVAEAILDEMIQRDAKYGHPFNALLTACRELDQPQRGVKVFAKMRHAKVKPNMRTYELLYSMFGSVNHPYEKGTKRSRKQVIKRISAIAMDVEANCIDPNDRMINFALKAIGNEGMVRRMLSYLRDAEEHFKCRNLPPLATFVYNTVLDVLVKAKQRNAAFNVFKRMKSLCVKPDATTYNVMIDCCSLDGDLETARRMMTAMLQDGLKFRSFTFTALSKVLLKTRDFRTVVGLTSEMRRHNVCPDVAYYNSILRAFAKSGPLRVVEFFVEQMHREKISPDPETCVRVFSCYARRRLKGTALEALQVLSLRMISEDEKVQRQAESTFQEFVLDENMSFEEFFNQAFNNYNESLAMALLNLRLCALNGLSFHWVPSESPWAKRLSMKYDEMIS